MLLVPDQLSSTFRILSWVKKNMLPSFPKHLPLSQFVLLSTLPHLYVLVLGWRTILGLLHRGLISFLVQKLLSRKLFLSVLAKIKNGSLNFFSLPHICCSPTFKLLVKNSIWLVSKFWTWVNQNTSVYFSATALCTPSAASFLLITLNVACHVWWREGLWKHEWHFADHWARMCLQSKSCLSTITMRQKKASQKYSPLGGTVTGWMQNSVVLSLRCCLAAQAHFCTWLTIIPTTCSLSSRVTKAFHIAIGTVLMSQ